MAEEEQVRLPAKQCYFERVMLIRGFLFTDAHHSGEGTARSDPAQLGREDLRQDAE